jgi:hypothetical protein
LPRRFVLAVVDAKVQLDAEVLEPGAEVLGWLRKFLLDAEVDVG